MTIEQVYAGMYARLLSARISDQIKVKEFYAQAAVLGRTYGQAKTDLTNVRKALRPADNSNLITEEMKTRIRPEYLRWARKCVSERIPVSLDLEGYCREKLEVSKVEAREPKPEPMPAPGPSYSYHVYVSPRNMAD